MAGRVKTQAFSKNAQDLLGVGGKPKNTEKTKTADKPSPDKNEFAFQRTFQQVIFAIILNLASNEKCRKNLCELNAFSVFAKYLLMPPIIPLEILQLALKSLFSLTTAANVNPFFGTQNKPLDAQTITTLLQLAHINDSSAQYLVASILDQLAKLTQYQPELGSGVATLLRLLSTVDMNVKKIILRAVTTLSGDDKVKKLIFDGGGIPTLIRIFSTNQPEIFPKVAQLLSVLTSNDAMRKAIVFTGGIGHLLNLLTSSHDEQELQIYTEAFSKVLVDDDGIAWLFHEDKCVHALVCLLYSNRQDVKLTAAAASSLILTNDNFKLKFDESGGTQALLLLLFDQNANIQIEAIKAITKLIQAQKIRRVLIDAGLIEKVKELGKHENVKGAGMETVIIQALRGLIVQIKVATQSYAPPLATKKPAETVWIKCKLGTYAKMAKVIVGDSLESFINTVLAAYNLNRVHLTFMHGSDEVALQSNADFDYVVECNKTDTKVDVIVRELQEVIPEPPPPPTPAAGPNGSGKLVKAYMDIQNTEALSSNFKPQVVIPVEPPKPLALPQILDFILRPLREDEIWSICCLASKLLYTIHRSGKLHKGIRQEVIVIDLDGGLILDDGPFLLDRFLAPETTDPTKCTTKADVYGLGAVMWTCADFLLDEDEEPSLGQELMFVIEQMTDDEPEERPDIGFILQESAKYETSACRVLKELMKEVERKKLLKRDYETKGIEKQVSFSKQLLGEIQAGITLKRVEGDATPQPTSKSLLAEIENASKTLKLSHVTPATRTIRRGTFLTDLEAVAAKRTVAIVEQAYVEGMRLWARDIVKWNEEIQKVFNWNKNMVRIIFRLVELRDDRVNFEDYAKILTIPKGQKLVEFLEKLPTKPTSGSKLNLAISTARSPSPAPQSSPATATKNSNPISPRSPTSTNTNTHPSPTSSPRSINQPPAVSPKVQPTPHPPGPSRTISSSAFTAARPGSPSPAPTLAAKPTPPSQKPSPPIASNPSQPSPTMPKISLAKIPSVPETRPRKLSIGSHKPEFKPNFDSQPATKPRTGSISESIRQLIRIITSLMTTLASSSTEVDLSTKQKFASSLTRVGFSIKLNKYIEGTSEHLEYLDIFRPEDLPLSAFMKAILVSLKATHMVKRDL